MPELKDGMLVSKAYPPVTSQERRVRKKRTTVPRKPLQSDKEIEVLLAQYRKKRISYSRFRKIVLDLGLGKSATASVGRRLARLGIVKILREQNGYPRSIVVLK